MKKYRVYAGMSGGFNNVVNHGVFEFKNEEEAMDYAYNLAREDYESYEGYHGVLDFGSCLDECDQDEEIASEMYEDEIQSWINYYVKEEK